MNHIDSSVLDTYVERPVALPSDLADRVEHHVLVCDTCRAQVAGRTTTADLTRSWSAIELRLRAEGSPDTDVPPVGRGVLVRRTRGGVDHVDRQRRTRARPVLVAAALVVLVAGLVWSAQLRREPAPTAAVPSTWDVMTTFTAAGDLLGIASLAEWRDALLVVGSFETPAGQRYVAWSETEDGWTQQLVDFPEGCDPWGGLAVVGELVAIGCARNQDREQTIVSVATTGDLSSWTVHEVGTVASSFGVIIGSDGADEVVVAVLEAADPNTTQGARLRVWTSRGLASWQQRPGADDGLLTDAFAQRIRQFGDDVVIVGATNTWPEGSAGPAGQHPAVWVSLDGAPFTGHLLPDESGRPAGGYAHDVTATADGFVAVGGTDGVARAWFSDDLTTWTPGTVADAGPLAPSGAGAMWSVAAAGPNLVAASIGTAVATPTWSSRDGGRTWHALGDGPSIVLHVDDAIVGVRTTAPFGLWQLELR